MAPPCLSSSQWRGRPPQRYKTPLASLEALTGAAFVISFDDVYGYWPRNLKQRWQLLPHTATACVRQCATRWKLLQFRSSRSCWWLSRRRGECHSLSDREPAAQVVEELKKATEEAEMKIRKKDSNLDGRESQVANLQLCTTVIFLYFPAQVSGSGGKVIKEEEDRGQHLKAMWMSVKIGTSPPSCFPTLSTYLFPPTCLTGYHTIWRGKKKLLAASPPAKLAWVEEAPKTDDAIPISATTVSWIKWGQDYSVILCF